MRAPSPSTADPPGEKPERLTTGVARRFVRHEVPTEAAALAFYAFLSLPPTFLVVFGLTGFFGGAETAGWITAQLQTALPGPAARTVIDEFVTQVVMETAPGPFSVGIAIALFAGSNVFAALGAALDRAYGIRHGRPWLRQRLVGLGVLVVFAVLFLSASAVILWGAMVAGDLEPWGITERVWSVGQWLGPYLLVVLAFWLSYILLPSRPTTGQEKGRLLVGALIAALFWLAATAGFRFYIASLGTFSETYGILGTMIVILLWMWISGMVVLLGGEIGAQLDPEADSSVG